MNILTRSSKNGTLIILLQATLQIAKVWLYSQIALLNTKWLNSKKNKEIKYLVIDLDIANLFEFTLSNIYAPNTEDMEWY